MTTTSDLNIEQRRSSDGHPYSARKTPSEIRIDGDAYCSSISTQDGYTFHHLFLKCKDLKRMCLPLDANPREPSNVKVVTQMAATLRDSPERFHHWNNGITVICDKFETSAGVCTVSFENGSGICNGGHTYFAIVTFPQEISDDANVHLEFVEIPSFPNEEERKHVINDIAANRNANRALLPTTQADYLGFYEPFKNAMGGKASKVIWHEGDSASNDNAINSELLIRMIACCDPFWYYHPIHSPARTNHKHCATGSRTIHNRWFDNQSDPECNLTHMAPIVNELFRICEIVSYSLKNDSDLTNVSGRWRGTKFYSEWLNGGDIQLSDYNPGGVGLKLPNPATIMFLGCFRSNVWLGKNEDGDVFLTGFLVDNSQLWNDAKIDLLTKLTSNFADCDQEPNQFIKNNTPYENQLLSIAYGKRPPQYPVYFHQLEDGTKFIQSTESPTHSLIVDEDGYAELLAYDPSLDSEQHYKASNA